MKHTAAPTGTSPRRTPAKLVSRRAKGLVDRDRLFLRLDREAETPLVWVQGPAGAGKSALVASYLGRQRQRPLWYRVDDGDLDVPTVLSYLAQGARLVSRKRRVELPAMTVEHLRNQADFLRRFFRLLFDALPPHAVLVFDGFELAAAGVLDSVLRSAVDELPPGQRLLVTSRTHPPEALAHLLTRGDMALVDGSELVLTEVEALQIAALRGPLPEAQVQQLAQAAGGWAAGFVVLLTHARRTGTAIAPLHLAADALFPYYLNELFARTAAEVQELLVRVALLPAFTAAQAVALAPGVDVPRVLDWLQRHHFFIDAGAGDEPVYTFHALFRQFLLEHGRRRLDGAQRRQLLQQAAGLLHAAGEADTALALLIEAGERASAAALLCRLAPAWLRQGRFAAVSTALSALPAGTSALEPWLVFWSGMAALAIAPARAVPEFQRSLEGFRAAADPVGQRVACAALLESMSATFGDMASMDRWAAELRQVLAGPAVVLPVEMEARVLRSQAVLVMRGDRHAEQVDAALVRARELLTVETDPARRVLLGAPVLYALYLRGEWAAGMRFAEEEAPVLARSGPPDNDRVMWQALHARLLVWGGDPLAALQRARQAEQLALEHQIGALATVAASASVFAALNLDDLPTAEAGLARMRATLVPSRRIDAVTLDLQRGLIALARGEPTPALHALQAASDGARQLGATLLVAQFGIVLAQAQELTGQGERAAQTLAGVCAFARAARTPMLEHSALMVQAWCAQRRTESREALDLLRRALVMGARHGWRLIFPWAPGALLQALAPLALEHGIEPALVRDMVRLRRVPPPPQRSPWWPWPVRVHTLGQFELLLDGRVFEPGSKAPRKPLELLRVLAVLGGREGVPLGVLEDALWPELDGAAARNALNVALHRLRKLLGGVPAAIVAAGRAQLDPQRVWTDLQALDHCLAAGPECPVDTLLTLYRGELLGDEPAPWAVVTRERLRSQVRRAVERQVEQLEATAAFEPAIDLLRRLVEVDPLAENAHRGLMRCLHAVGRRAEALEAYRRCETLLERVLGARPSPATLALLRLISS